MLNSSSATSAICNFCLSQPADWLFVSAFGFLRVLKTDDGTPLLQSDDGRWAACLECAPLIEDGNVPALTERVVDAVITRTGLVLSIRDRGALASQYQQHFSSLLALPMTRQPLPGRA
ncbi:hypothetical protein [Streptomyces boninensis]|uniref:hypothetical protein n=1 Tax=Streptomyces boninensis TaxID=2039455 RepID=UPI003B22369F